MDLQASLGILTTSSDKPSAPQADLYGRMPFQHPALETLERLTEGSKAHILDKERMAKLAERYGLFEVVRWQPKNVIPITRIFTCNLTLILYSQIRNLRGSGRPLVMSQALYAIFGAVALQKGGLIANRLVQERILDRLGLRQ